MERFIIAAVRGEGPVGVMGPGGKYQIRFIESKGSGKITAVGGGNKCFVDDA